MKNFIKITALVAAAVFAAVSCQPVVELTDFDWGAANASRDAELNALSASNFAPTATIQYVTGTASPVTLSDFEVTITFPTRADVLRGNIAKDDLSFITFHTFTKVDILKLEADELSAAISYDLVDKGRAGNVIKVKLNHSVSDASKTYSNLVMRIDAKNYTYDHGLRLDVDENGRIEDVYDDYYWRQLDINNGSGTTYVAVGQRNLGYSLPDFDTTVTTEATAPSGTNSYNFYFVDKGEKSNKNTVAVAAVGFVGDSTTDAYYKDIGETLAKGIKLQKLNGTSWSDVGSAKYDATLRDATGAEASSGRTRIIIEGVEFDHLATYRFIWTGDAFTETSGTYYGVKQRLYVNTGYTPSRKYNQTEVAAAPFTPYNTNLINTLDLENIVTTSVKTHDSSLKNNVLRLDLGASYNWKKLDLDAFKASFQIVASPTSVGNDSKDMYYIDIVNIEYAKEAPTGTDLKDILGDNVLYITIDPNFKYDSGAHDAWEAAGPQWNDQFQVWWYNGPNSPYLSWSAANTAYLASNSYQTYLTDLATYNKAVTDYEATVDDDTNANHFAGDGKAGDPGTTPPSPPAGGPGAEPMQWDNLGGLSYWSDTYGDGCTSAYSYFGDHLWQAIWDAYQNANPPPPSLFYKVNTNIGVTENKAADAKSFVFGNLTDNFFGNFEYYLGFK